MDWTLWIVAIIGVLSIAAFLWFLGRNYRQSELMEAKRKAENAELEKRNAERTAEIFSLPRGDKPDVISRL